VQAASFNDASTVDRSRLRKTLETMASSDERHASPSPRPPLSTSCPVLRAANAGARNDIKALRYLLGGATAGPGEFGKVFGGATVASGVDSRLGTFRIVRTYG
jgi:hypothetical protein